MADRIFPISSDKTSWSDSVRVLWNVQQQESTSGLVRTLVEQDLPKYEYELIFPVLTGEEKDKLIGFYNLCKGGLLPFFIKPYNCHIEKQTLAKGTDGKYQLVKKSGDFVEAITKADNLLVYVNGTKKTGFTESDGKVAISTTGTVSASYDYYELVRFAEGLTITERYKNVYSCTVKVVTAR